LNRFFCINFNQKSTTITNSASGLVQSVKESIASDNGKYNLIIGMLLILIVILVYFLYKAYSVDNTIVAYSLYRDVDSGTVKCVKKLTKTELTPKFSNDFTAMVWVKIDKST